MQYQTSNLNEAAFLLCAGFTIKETRRTAKRVYWTFSDGNANFERLIENYENNTTKVAPKMFVDYQNELKDMVFMGGADGSR